MCAWPGQSEHHISLAAGVGPRKGTNQNQLEWILGSLGWRNPERGAFLKLGRRESGAAGWSQERNSFLRGRQHRDGGDRLLLMPREIWVQLGLNVSGT